MNIHRFYCEKITEPVSELAGPDARHLASVLRLQKGQQVELFDGRGAAGMAAIKTITDKMIILDVKSLRVIPQRTTGRIILAVSIAKGERFDWLVEKCTELGIDRLCPVLFERTVKSAAGSQILQRWKRLAISAAKQSGRYLLPVIDKPDNFSNVIKTLKNQYPASVFLYGSLEPDAKALMDFAFDDKDVIAFVGPEGGLTDGERQLLLECGAKTVRLTDTILRVETAALAFASILAAMREARSESAGDGPSADCIS